jgi:hypothetical protein
VRQGQFPNCQKDPAFWGDAGLLVKKAAFNAAAYLGDNRKAMFFNAITKM